jgi:membrane protein implicated in regulation of membrane protease activity
MKGEAAIMENYMWIVWLCVFVLAMIVEAVLSGLNSIWFAAAAIIVLFLSFIPNLPYWGEILIFVGLSVILLLATRPFVKKFNDKRNSSKTNLDRYIGNKYKLNKKVEKGSVGEITVNGVPWNVDTEDGQEIEAGKWIEVISIEGNKFIVKETNNE